jgi:hypothetical protein
VGNPCVRADTLEVSAPARNPGGHRAHNGIVNHVRASGPAKTTGGHARSDDKARAKVEAEDTEGNKHATKGPAAVEADDTEGNKHATKIEPDDTEGNKHATK